MLKTELIVPSDLRFLEVVEHWLLESLQLEIGQELDWTGVKGRLRLVVVEVYSNIVRHAHNEQPDLPVLIRIELEDNNLSLEVWDQGKGFKLDDYAAPMPGDFQEGGYGWLILHRIMDRVEYQLRVGGDRNCLKLEKDLAATAAGPTG
ncbi:MAG: serine/threonine-protein kinase RsbW [Phormidesmis priestleyi Ana]|uniref:Serine/threonine-protein kinase RsbW n=1 Tax=Phormidesmis priestleyi Ana TaxID=1666911 RepID=A0A0P7ZM72_9CYAN|nr:MAG: serine/threonine-protein kinase RsbW [Phormidesmis priestleyi Ana]